MLDKQGYIHTRSEYVILIAFPWQRWLRERASILGLHVHCLPCLMVHPRYHNYGLVCCAYTGLAIRHVANTLWCSHNQQVNHAHKERNPVSAESLSTLGGILLFDMTLP
jgi:hypothetical protein